LERTSTDRLTRAIYSTRPKPAQAFQAQRLFSDLQIRCAGIKKAEQREFEPSGRDGGFKQFGEEFMRRELLLHRAEKCRALLGSGGKGFVDINLGEELFERGRKAAGDHQIFQAGHGWFMDFFRCRFREYPTRSAFSFFKIGALGNRMQGAHGAIKQGYRTQIGSDS
jgi:hypothetical protein